MTAAVTIRNVTRDFGSHRALDGATLDVARGEAVAVLGPSGCGKTTLLRVVAGLEVPDSGDVWLDGNRVADAGRNRVPPHLRGIGFVFQDLALWPHLTVAGNLEFVMESLGVSRADQPKRSRDALGLVRIDHLSTRYPHQLSGGEQQRAALARALVCRPRLLLMDEPLSSLDPDLRDALRAELRRLQLALGITTMYVTHDVQDAAVLADRVVAMRAGRITGASGTTVTGGGK